MQSLKILIVEDDFMFGQVLEKRLLELGYIVIAKVADSDSAELAFRREIPDLIILDIELKSSKLDGIQLAEVLNKIERVPIVYLTAFSDKKTKERAKKTQPAYFLIKPCSKAQLEVAIDFAIDNYAKKQEAEIDHSLKYHTPPLCVFYSANDFFFAKKKQRYVRVNLNDILWVKSNNSYVEIITAKNKLIGSMNLKDFTFQIQHPNLLRIHRSFLINLLKISAFDDRHVFIEKDNVLEEIPVGKTYREEVFNRFRQLKAG